MIDLANIHLRLPSLAGEVHILRGIDLSLAAGEAAALVGPSGSGKSTLMMVLAGLERPSDGTVAVAGRVTSRIATSAAIPGRSGSPSRSTTRPMGPAPMACVPAESTSSATTISPSVPRPSGIRTS